MRVKHLPYKLEDLSSNFQDPFIRVWSHGFVYLCIPWGLKFTQYTRTRRQSHKNVVLFGFSDIVVSHAV